MCQNMMFGCCFVIGRFSVESPATIQPIMQSNNFNHVNSWMRDNVINIGIKLMLGKRLWQS